MTQENKDLLFKDLSSRLIYKVKFPIYWWNEETQTDEEIVATLYSINTDGYCEIFDHDGTVYIDNIKPYLRPMSSMTNEEINKIQTILGGAIEVRNDFINNIDTEVHTISFLELQAVFDFLNKNHFDYNELIPKGLAIEASKDIYNLN